ncbi:sulfate transporter CysZ [Montanilutibacter psychrotolerans]|uniref:Sulfate transporter CysZ n=1 Tax=Montanilutibacter psychrotolerans TaxID=1327343 RepID=A0A3M8SUN6_9GAMM|nr:sulfate transporter CysZ [Lysobacter psychrotolerans]RNF85037.1 sulfate transporter CysZ [Lysobacter psychrotolerans]
MDLHRTGLALAQHAVSPLAGARYLLRGYRMLFNPGIRRFVAWPLLANLVLLTLAFAGALWGMDWLLDRWISESWSWVNWILKPLLGLLLLAVTVLSFGLVGQLLLAPFYGLLARRVEMRLRGGSQEVEIPLMVELRQSLRLQLRILGYVAVRLLLVLVVSLIPGLGLLAAPINLLFAGWLLAIETAGNPLGNWGWAPQRQLAFLRRHRSAAIGFGVCVVAASLVPVLNFAAMPAAVCGMTAFCLDHAGPED